MKASNLLLLLLGFLVISSCKQINPDNSANKSSQESAREYYQLKTYTFDTEVQVASTDNYLKDAYLPAMKRLGIANIGVFKPRPETDSLKKIYVLIPYSSLSQILSVEEELAMDSTYLLAGSKYINASYDQPPYQRIESTIMKAFDEMPSLKASAVEGPRENRVYELRSYQSPTEAYHKNKVEMFNEGGEVELFESLNFNAVFYASVISGSKMPNLMYMTTFSDLESQTEHWNAFRESPVWTELKAIEKYKNSVSHSDKYYLYPTDYSDY